MKIVLASASPRRQALLTQIGILYEVIVDETPEDMSPGTAPSALVETNAVKKAVNVNRTVHEPCIIIAADTVVALDGIVMGKPVNEADARDMLRRLSGRRHEVYTGVCLIRRTTYADDRGIGSEQESFVDKTSVFIRKITDQEIESYIKTGEPMDKAGAYAVQGFGAVFVEKVIGDYYTVVGLPLSRFYTALKKFLL